MFGQFLAKPQFSKGNHGDGLHWEEGGRADEVEVLLAFSNFLDFLTNFFYQVMKFRTYSVLFALAT